MDQTASVNTENTEITSSTTQTGANGATQRSATPITIRSLLDAGAHFGHQSHRWNPKMLPFIYGERNGIHIINLDSTMRAWTRARDFIVGTLSRGGTILFVGTKLQAREMVREEAQRCGAFHVTSRWLGGMLSNFQTIRRSIDRMRKLEELLKKSEENSEEVRLTKRERLTITRELEKLNASLGGIRDMRRPPDLLFVVDVTKEEIAIKEANKLRIPIVALVDTNANPDNVDFPIPSNDDAARTIKLFVSAAADAVLEGRAEFEARRPKETRQAEARAAAAAEKSDRAAGEAPAAQ